MSFTGSDRRHGWCLLDPEERFIAVNKSCQEESLKRRLEDDLHQCRRTALAVYILHPCCVLVLSCHMILHVGCPPHLEEMGLDHDGSTHIRSFPAVVKCMILFRETLIVWSRLDGLERARR